MTKRAGLFSGKVLKINGARLSVDRDKWIRLEETEPDLGTATVDNSFLIGSTDNTREWTPNVFLTYPINPNTNLPETQFNVSGNLQVDGNINGIIQVDVSPATISLPDGAAIKIGNDIVLTQTTLGTSVVNSSLEAVGTITQGTWEADPISPAYGGTGIGNPAGVTPNTVLYGQGTSPMLETNVGTSGQVLQITDLGNPAFDIINGGGWAT